MSLDFLGLLKISALEVCGESLWLEARGKLTEKKGLETVT